MAGIANTPQGKHFAFGAFAKLANGRLYAFANDSVQHAAASSNAIRCWTAASRSAALAGQWTVANDVWLNGAFCPGGLGGFRWSTLDYYSGIAGINNVKEASAFVTSMGDLIVCTWDLHGAQYTPMIFRAQAGSALDAGFPSWEPVCVPQIATKNSYTNKINSTGMTYGILDTNGDPQVTGHMSSPCIEIGSGPTSTLLTLLWSRIDQQVVGFGNAVNVIRSTNRGRTWDYLAQASARDATETVGYVEPTLVGPHPVTGQLAIIYRTGDDIRRIQYSTGSHDGSTWGPIIYCAGMPGGLGARASTVLCSNGDLVHTARPVGFGRYGVFTVSHDFGFNWSVPDVYTLGVTEVTPGPGGYGDVYGQMIEVAPNVLGHAFAVESDLNGNLDEIAGGTSGAYLFYDELHLVAA